MAFGKLFENLDVIPIVEVEQQPVVADGQVHVAWHGPALTPCGEPVDAADGRLGRQCRRCGIDAPLRQRRTMRPHCTRGRKGKAATAPS